MPAPAITAVVAPDEAAADLIPDLPALGRALQAVAFPATGRTMVDWDEFFTVTRNAEMEREADAALRAIGHAVSAPVTGLAEVLDLVADGRLPKAAEVVFAGLPPAETTERITDLITLLLALAALRSGAARWRHSWSGTAELVAIDGGHLDLAEPASLAADPATVDLARTRLAELGIDLSVTARPDPARPPARVPVHGGVVNVLADGVRTDLLILETGLLLIPSLPRSRNGDSRRRLARLAAAGINPDGSLAASPRASDFSSEAVPSPTPSASATAAGAGSSLPRAPASQPVADSPAVPGAAGSQPLSGAAGSDWLTGAGGLQASGGATGFRASAPAGGFDAPFGAAGLKGPAGFHAPDGAAGSPGLSGAVGSQAISGVAAPQAASGTNTGAAAQEASKQARARGSDPRASDPAGALEGRLVPYADVVRAAVMQGRRRQWELTLASGAVLTLRTTLDSDELQGGWAALEEAVAFLTRTRTPPPTRDQTTTDPASRGHTPHGEGSPPPDQPTPPQPESSQVSGVPSPSSAASS